MATVYEAVREPEGERVAVKVLVPRTRSDWLAWELFEHSSRVLQSLSHPGLPRTHGFERGEAARLVLVREVFDGGTLFERIRHQDCRLTAVQIRHLLEALLELLAYLQALVPPVVHRDIKPSNIMFRTPGDWEPVLVDFDTIAPPPGLGSGLTIVGTPGYAAPEQLATAACAASDVYGLGATMLFVVTHLDADRLPRDGFRFAVDPPLRPLGHVGTVLRRMIEPDLARRYPSAAEALADLRDGAAGASALPRPSREEPAPLEVRDPREHDIPTLLLRDDAPAPTWLTAAAPPPAPPSCDEAAALLAGTLGPDVVPPPEVFEGRARGEAVLFGDRRTFRPIGRVSAGARLRLLDRRVQIDPYGANIVNVQVVTCADPAALGQRGWVPIRATDFTTEPALGGPLVAVARG
jgi:serine/threonine protein kinase